MTTKRDRMADAAQALPAKRARLTLAELPQALAELPPDRAATAAPLADDRPDLDELLMLWFGRTAASAANDATGESDDSSDEGGAGATDPLFGLVHARYSKDGYVTLSEAPKAVNVIVGGTATLAATAMYLAKYLIKNDALALTDEYGDDGPPPLLDSDDELLRSWHGVSYARAASIVVPCSALISRV